MFLAANIYNIFCILFLYNKIFLSVKNELNILNKRAIMRLNFKFIELQNDF